MYATATNGRSNDLNSLTVSSNVGEGASMAYAGSASGGAGESDTLRLGIQLSLVSDGDFTSSKEVGLNGDSRVSPSLLGSGVRGPAESMLRSIATFSAVRDIQAKADL